METLLSRERAIKIIIQESSFFHPNEGSGRGERTVGARSVSEPRACVHG